MMSESPTRETYELSQTQSGNSHPHIPNIGPQLLSRWESIVLTILRLGMSTDPPIQSSGEIVKLAETDVYISRPSDIENQGTCFLLLLTNGVGINSVANQLQADHFAREGYFVAMPDLFEGDFAPNATSVTSHIESQDLLEQIKFKAAESIKGFLIGTRSSCQLTRSWVISKYYRYVACSPHSRKDHARYRKVLNAVKEEYGDRAYTVSPGTYVVGYCFGGKYALRLAATDQIIAGCIAHGTLMTKEDIEAVKKPISFACVDDIRDEGLRCLEKNNIEFEMRTYEGVPHGFGVYGSYSEEHIKSAQKQVFQQFLEFMGKR